MFRAKHGPNILPNHTAFSNPVCECVHVYGQVCACVCVCFWELYCRKTRALIFRNHILPVRRKKCGGRHRKREREIDGGMRNVRECGTGGARVWMQEDGQNTKGKSTVKNCIHEQSEMNVVLEIPHVL